MTIRGKKLIAGVGVNDSPVPTSRKINGKMIHNKDYNLWMNMINRCYRNTGHYANVTVCDDWLIFSNFRSWYEKHGVYGWSLDKDLRGDGTLYSPETCTMLPEWMNGSLNSQRHPAIYRHKRQWRVGFDVPKSVRVNTYKEAVDLFHSYFLGTNQYREWCLVNEDVRLLWIEKKGLPKDIWMAIPTGTLQ